MIRITVPLEIQQGRNVRPLKPLLSWQLLPGMKLTLPAEIEDILISEGFAEQAGRAANTLNEGK